MHDRGEILARLRPLIIRLATLQLSAEDINEDDSFFGPAMGLDSMTLLELVIAVENEFDVYFAEDDLDVKLFGTVATFVDAIAAKTPEST